MVVLNPNCSVWIGKLNNRKYKDTYNEYTDEKTGEKIKELEEQDCDIEISTDTFPNGGLSTAIDCVKQGYGIDDIEWDNQGGGAHGEVLEKDFRFAELIVNFKIELSSEEIDILDGLIWDKENTETQQKIDEMFSKLKSDKLDKFAFSLCEMDGKAFGKIMLENPHISKKVKQKIKR